MNAYKQYQLQVTDYFMKRNMPQAAKAAVMFPLALAISIGIPLICSFSLTMAFLPTFKLLFGMSGALTAGTIVLDAMCSKLGANGKNLYTSPVADPTDNRLAAAGALAPKNDRGGRLFSLWVRGLAAVGAIAMLIPSPIEKKKETPPVKMEEKAAAVVPAAIPVPPETAPQPAAQPVAAIIATVTFGSAEENKNGKAAAQPVAPAETDKNAELVESILSRLTNEEKLTVTASHLKFIPATPPMMHDSYKLQLAFDQEAAYLPLHPHWTKNNNEVGAVELLKEFNRQVKKNPDLKRGLLSITAWNYGQDSSLGGVEVGGLPAEMSAADYSRLSSAPKEMKIYTPALTK